MASWQQENWIDINKDTDRQTEKSYEASQIFYPSTVQIFSLSKADRKKTLFCFHRNFFNVRFCESCQRSHQSSHTHITCPSFTPTTNHPRISGLKNTSIVWGISSQTLKFPAQCQQGLTVTTNLQATCQGECLETAHQTTAAIAIGQADLSPTAFSTAGSSRIRTAAAAATAKTATTMVPIPANSKRTWIFGCLSPCERET